MRSASPIVVTLLLVGCAGDEEVIERRLIAHGWAIDGLGVVERGIRDTELDADCAPAPDADGTWRCFPFASALGVSEEPADETCELSIATFYGPPPDRYFSVGEFGCDGVESVEAYEIVNGPLPVPYTKEQWGCVPASDPRESRRDYYGVRPVPNDRFAELTLETQTLDADLIRVDVRDAQGSTFLYELKNARYGERCLPGEHDGVVACLPASAMEEVFADIACTQHALRTYATDEACEPPQLAFGTTYACDAERTLYEVNDWTTTSEPSYALLGDLCVDQPAYSEVVELRVTPVDVRDVAPILETTVEGTGRVTARYYTAQDGTIVAPRSPRLHDTQLDAACFVASTTAGLRCVPGDAGRVDYLFADDACTEPIAVVATTSTPAVALEIDPDDGETLTIYEVEPFDGVPDFYWDAEGQYPCSPLVYVGCDISLHTIGAELDATRYPAAREVP